MTAPQRLFLTGIHGAGKSTIGKSLQYATGKRYASCSNLIRLARGDMRAWARSPGEIGDNQSLLVNKLQEEDGNNPIVILDGHCSLALPEGKLQRIDVSVFSALSVHTMCLVSCDPDIIVRRLLERDGKQVDVTFVRRHLAFEEESASAISRELRIEMRILDSEDPACTDSIKELMRSW